MTRDEQMHPVSLEPAAVAAVLLASPKRREQFMATLRHELRTPMNHIIGYSEMLIEEATEQGDDHLVTELGKIHHEGQRLLTIINDLFAPHKPRDNLQGELFETRHEMRTLVNSIIGLSELLQEDSYPPGMANFIRDLDKIKGAAHQLLGLIDGSAEASKIKQTSASLSPQKAHASVNPVLMAEQCGSLLVVDDNDANRDMLSRRLERLGHRVATAADGFRALEIMADRPFDLVLLDVMMPEMDGHETLSRIKADDTLRHIPVIMISALDDISSIVRCIEMGAEDYIPKPFDPILLKARIGASLEKKRLRDQEVVYRKQIEEYNLHLEDRVREQVSSIMRAQMETTFITKTFGRYMSDEVVEKLLDSPDGLALGGQSLTVTVVFTDLRGFSSLSESLPSETVVEMLNDYLKEMTAIIFEHAGTINEIMGDGMLLLFGAPTMRPDDADRAIACAIEMQLAMAQVNERNRQKGLPSLEMGIGINTGKVVAGNVGSDIRAKYAVVGSNVNLAARVESFSVGGQILATQSTLDAVSEELKLVGEFSVPFKGVKKPVNIFDIAGIGGKYNLALPEILVNYQALEQPLQVAFEVLDGKRSSGETAHGHIMELAEKCARFVSPFGLETLSNLRLSLCSHADPESFVYAKVMKCFEEGVYEINFTSLPEEIRGLFQGLRDEKLNLKK